MELFLNIVFLILGLAFLIKGADAFVDGASTIAKILKVPSLIIGLTIVALGTSLPELSVSVVAAINHSVDMSVGNVVGSNIFNILMVLGLTAWMMPVAIERKVLKFELPFVLFVSLFLMVIAFTGTATVEWYYGLSFLLLTVFYIAFLIFRTKREEKPAEEEGETSRDKKSVLKAVAYLILGGAAIVFGGECVNSTAPVIAKACGMDEKLIALTIVALGTSLPELVTSLIAARKGENGIAIGNVIGSNTLNILLILGISSFITPLPISSQMTVDIVFMVFITVVLIVLALFAVRKKGLYRISGAIFVSLYILYMIYIICRNYGTLPEWMIV